MRTNLFRYRDDNLLDSIGHTHPQGTADYNLNAEPSNPKRMIRVGRLLWGDYIDEPILNQGGSTVPYYHEMDGDPDCPGVDRIAAKWSSLMISRNGSKQITCG